MLYSLSEERRKWRGVKRRGGVSIDSSHAISSWVFVSFSLQKESKPKEKKAPKQEEADEEEDEAPKPKPEKSPLDSLPPSPMVMDAWKRLYSNTKGNVFREVAVKGQRGGACVCENQNCVAPRPEGHQRIVIPT